MTLAETRYSWEDVSKPGALHVCELACESLHDPLGIDIQFPRLSWKDTGAGRNRYQTAYRLLVASSLKNLSEDKGDLWDSKKVISSNNAGTKYRGKQLAPRQQCFWKVKVWDENADASAWSEPAHWSMGLIRRADWGEARWIGGPPDPLRADDKASEGNHVSWRIPPSPMLRKEFVLNRAISHAEVSVTALGEYELRLNGSRVGDQQLAPGWTNYRERAQIQTYDVTRLLKKGDNALGAMLGDGWYAGKLAGTRWSREFPHRGLYGPSRALLLRLDIVYTDGSRSSTMSDGSWKIDTSGPVRTADHFEGETYDARKEQPGWDKPDFDDGRWQAATVKDQVNISLSAQISEPIRIVTTIHPRSVTETAPGVYLFKLPQNISGWCRIRLGGAAGTVITLRHAETLNADGSLFTKALGGAYSVDKYILNGKDPRWFEPHFTYHGFQYVEVSGLAQKPTTDMLEGRVVTSDLKQTGEFTCSEPLLNEIWKLAFWTQRANMVSVPTDCPNRDERYGYGADALSFSGTAIFNMNAEAFYRKWMRDWREAQSPSGTLPPFAPYPYFKKADLEAKDISGWSDAGAIMPWILYGNYGDSCIVRQQYSSVRRFVDQLRTQAKENILNIETCGDWLSQAMIEGVPGYPQPEGDWTGVPNDVFCTIFLYESTLALSKMAGLLHEEADALYYSQAAGNIREAFITNFVCADGTIDGNNQSVYTLVLYYNLLPDSLRSLAASQLVKQLHRYDDRLATGIVATSKLLPVLSRFGYNELAYRVMESRRFPSVGFMIDQGATTIWERWDDYVPTRGMDSSGMTSFNHVALGGQVEWLYSNVLGINADPVIPAFKQFIIRPRPGGTLTMAKGSYESVQGSITTGWEFKNKQFLLSVDIPANTSARIVIPLMGSKEVMESLIPLAKAKGIRQVSYSADEVAVETGSGHYRFSVSLEKPRGAETGARSSRIVGDQGADMALNFLKNFAPVKLKEHFADSLPLRVNIENQPMLFSYDSPETLVGWKGVIGGKILFHYDPDHKSCWYQLQLTNTGSDTARNITIDPLALRFFANHEIEKPVVRYMTGNFHYDGLYPPRAYELHERVFMTNDHGRSLTIDGTDGASAYNYVPMMQFALAKNSGLAGFMVGFEWSGGWSMNAGWENPVFEGPGASDFLLEGNMRFGKFYIYPGQTLLFPKIHLVFFEGDTWNILDNAQKKYISESLAYRVRGKPNYHKVTYDHWFGVHGDFDLSLLMQQAKRAAALGVEYFCLDAGWYGNGFFGSSNTGKWDEPDPVKFPNGIADIKKLSDYCRDHGMGFGLWHQIDWRNGGGNPIDYGNPKEKEEALGVLRKWIKQWNLTWMRWEMAGPAKAESNSLAYWQGYYEVMDSLLKEFPDLIIECCSGGGSRFDLGMASRTASTWLNDHTAEGEINRYMQMGAMRFWPGYFLSLAVRVHRRSGDKEANACNVINRMPGSLSFNGMISEWSDMATAKIRCLVDVYKRVRNLQTQSAYFPLPQPQNYRDWDAVCFGNGGKEDQLLYVFRMEGKEKVYMELPEKKTGWKLVMTSVANPQIKKSGKGYEISLPPHSAAVWER